MICWNMAVGLCAVEKYDCLKNIRIREIKKKNIFRELEFKTESLVKCDLKKLTG